MANVKYVNKATGKKYTASSEDVAVLKSNTVLANAFAFEAEEAQPTEPKSKTTAATSGAQ